MPLLSGLVLPDRFRRESPIPPRRRHPDFAARHDFHTIWYDAFWRDGAVILVCPKLHNFERLVRRAEWRLDGRRAALRRIVRRSRHDMVHIAAPDRPARIEIAVEGFAGGSAVGATLDARFAGRNVHVAISRNNDLGWIRDFAMFHRQTQGLQAMVLFDNASDAYGIEDIEAALAPVGLDTVLVVPTPYPYGPPGWSKYLQTAVLEIARLRFVARARAVLLCDIDELVLSGREGRSIFDAAAGSRLGFASIDGEWYYPRPGTAPPFVHADHVFRKASPRRSPAKYCIVPDGPLRGLSWNVHKPHFVSFDKLMRRRDLRFIHCRGVTTNWKPNRRLAIPADVLPDPEVAAALRRVFGDRVPAIAGPPPEG